VDGGDRSAIVSKLTRNKNILLTGGFDTFLANARNYSTTEKIKQ